MASPLKKSGFPPSRAEQKLHGSPDSAMGNADRKGATNAPPVLTNNAITERQAMIPNMPEMGCAQGAYRLPASVAVIHVHNQANQANEAFDAYRAMCLAEQASPDLRDNPFWVKHRDRLYSDWFALFERVDG